MARVTIESLNLRAARVYAQLGQLEEHLINMTEEVK